MRTVKLIEYGFLFLLISASKTLLAYTDTDMTDLDPELKVITPTLMLQSISDSPAPVTIINRQQILSYGVRNIPDALRLVPGMAVASTSGNEYRINYHGTNGILPRRMQVLIDGMSIYRSSLSRVDWETIPVAVDDIERIEVTRAPSGSTYGTNAFFAVVNIITRKPTTNNVNVVEGFIGGQGDREIYGKYADADLNSGFYVTARAVATNGFDHLNNPVFVGTDVMDGNDHLQQNQVTGRYVRVINDNLQLDTELALVDKTKGTIQQDSTGIFGTDETGLDIYYRLGLDYTPNDRHQISIDLNYVSNENNNRFNACFEQLLLTPEMRNLYQENPTLALQFASGSVPVGSTPEEISLINDVLQRISSMGVTAYTLTCGKINIDDKDSRVDVLVHDIYVINDSVRMVTGLNISTIGFESAYHLGGIIRNNRYSLFNNTEFKPNDDFTINIGLLGEMEEDYRDERIFWSPRFALNYHLNENYTIRLSTTRSYRTPDLYERESDWQIMVSDLSAPVLGSTEALHFFAVSGNPLLSPEEIRSTELGLYATTWNNRVNIDISVYHQELTDLISNGVSTVFTPHDNHGVVTLDGMDMGLVFKLDDSVNIDMGYAYQNSNANDPNEEILYTEHAGFVGVIKAVTERLTVAAKYHAASNVTGGDYSRLEMSATNTFYKSVSSSVDGRVMVRYLQPEHVMVTSQVGELDFSNDDNLYIMAGISAKF
jgi:iron complex outermembrane receptor protein